MFKNYKIIEETFYSPVQGEEPKVKYRTLYRKPFSLFWNDIEYVRCHPLITQIYPEHYVDLTDAYESIDAHKQHLEYKKRAKKFANPKRKIIEYV